MSTLNKIIKKLAVSAFAFALTLSVIPVANADEIGDYKYEGVTIRSCGRTSCTAKGMGYPKQGAVIRCIAMHGDTIDGNSNWNFHQNMETGVTGYSTASYMSITESGPVPYSDGDTCMINPR